MKVTIAALGLLGVTQQATLNPQGKVPTEAVENTPAADATDTPDIIKAIAAATVGKKIDDIASGSQGIRVRKPLYCPIYGPGVACKCASKRPIREIASCSDDYESDYSDNESYDYRDDIRVSRDYGYKKPAYKYRGRNPCYNKYPVAIKSKCGCGCGTG
jgi:hypothetical protein